MLHAREHDLIERVFKRLSWYCGDCGDSALNRFGMRRESGERGLKDIGERYRRSASIKCTVTVIPF
jgi:hypothetical protein